MRKLMTSIRFRMVGMVTTSMILTLLVDVLFILLVEAFMMLGNDAIYFRDFFGDAQLIFLHSLNFWRRPIWVLGIIVVSVVCFLLFFTVLSSPMISYFREITAGIERIQQGDFDTRISIRNQGELMKLAISVNELQEELKQSIEHGRRTEQVKDELITNVAHDLRTPLTSIIGYLDLLQEENLSLDKRDKYLQIAYNKSLRLEGLVNDLFDFTRYEKNKIVMNPQQIEMKQFMEQILDEFYPQLVENQLECYTTFPKEKLYLTGDGELLARAFCNLMGNAVKYGAKGKQLKLELEQKWDMVRVAIINYGYVIPRKDIAKVFDKFYRADSSRAEGSGGTGLGLAIAQNIVEMHGGSIKATSSELGTVFEVLLPINHKTK